MEFMSEDIPYADENILNKMDIFMIFLIIIVSVFIAYLILICIANKKKV